jgi:hypothetical protein
VHIDERISMLQRSTKSSLLDRKNDAGFAQVIPVETPYRGAAFFLDFQFTLLQYAFPPGEVLVQISRLEMLLNKSTRFLKALVKGNDIDDNVRERKNSLVQISRLKMLRDKLTHVLEARVLVKGNDIRG